MNKVKEIILGYLRKLRKVCNPIRWLGYVRPEEVTGTKFQDTTNEPVKSSLTTNGWSKKRDLSATQICIGVDSDGDFATLILDPNDSASEFDTEGKLYCYFPEDLLEEYFVSSLAE